MRVFKLKVLKYLLKYGSRMEDLKGIIILLFIRNKCTYINSNF